jgi:hypothetical protein
MLLLHLAKSSDPKFNLKRVQNQATGSCGTIALNGLLTTVKKKPDCQEL